MAEMSEMSDAEFERLLGRLMPLVNTMVTAAVRAAVARAPVMTAQPADIIDIDGAEITVATSADPSGTVPATRATTATQGQRCLLLYVPGGGAFALGLIPT